MVPNYTVGTDVENTHLRNEAHWFERVLPEIDWDESEAALLVEALVGRFQMRGDA